MVVLIVALGTLGKLGKPVASALAERISRGERPGDADRIQALQAEVQMNEQRVALTEERVNELTEKLSFMENLLAQPAQTAELPRPPQ